MVRLFSQINNSTNAEELLSFPNVDLNKVNNNVDTNIVVSEEVDSESDDDEDDVLDEVDEEIEAQLTEMSKLNFSNSINNEFNEEEMDSINGVNFDFENEYDFSRGEPIETLDIVLGSDKLPRFSCAAHKTNISVRAAIKQHSQFSKILKELSKFCGLSHRSINIANYHSKNKTRLRCDNKTRWNSSFMMLLSIKRAYEKKTFDENYKCPYTLEVVEKYIQVLQPAYRYSLFMQQTDAPIGDVLPALLIMLQELEKLKINGTAVSGSFKSLRDLLVKSFRKKFNYELNSQVYLVASLFSVTKLHLWYNRSFSKEYALKAIESIEEVLLKFSPINNRAISTGSTRYVLPSIDNESKDEESILEKFASQVSESDSEDVSQVSFLANIKREKDTFINLLQVTDLKSIKSSLKFWRTNSNLFPNICRVALILKNISSNSSFVERFFSLTGGVCNEQAGNMEDDLIISRSLVKTNIKLLG